MFRNCRAYVEQDRGCFIDRIPARHVYSGHDDGCSGRTDQKQTLMYRPDIPDLRDFRRS